MAQRIKKNEKTKIFIISIIIFVITFFILYNLERNQPLVHDEAVYLTKAMSWQKNTPADEFKIYRPIGMAFAGRIMLQIDNSLQVVRLFGVIFGAITALLIFLLFNEVYGKIVGVSVALTTIFSTIFLKNAPQFLNDIPSAGLLFGSLWIILIWIRTKGESRLIYALPLFLASAFYLRYGVASTLFIIFIFSILILYKKIQKDSMNYEKIVDIVIISFLLFLPHFIEAYIFTGDILGILKRGNEAAGYNYIGEGLLNYIKWMPNDIGGWLIGGSSIMGISYIFLSIFKIRKKQIDINTIWLGTISLINFILIGLFIHAEPRYIFFSIVIFSGIGIANFINFFKKNKIIKLIFLIVYFSLIIFNGYNNFKMIGLFLSDKATGLVRVSYVNASREIIANNKNNDGCVIHSVSLRPEFSWYTKCRTFNINNDEIFKKNILINFRKNHYSIVFSEYDGKQLDLKMAKDLDISLEEIHRERESGNYGDIIVYKISNYDGIRLDPSIESE